MTKTSRNLALVLGLGMAAASVAQTVPAPAGVPQPQAPVAAPSVAPAVAPVGQPAPVAAAPAPQAAAPANVAGQVPLPAPGNYAQQGGVVPAPVPVQQASPLPPSSAPTTPPSSLPPLPGPNTAEVAAAQDALFGVTPEQIRELRRMLDARQRASSELVNPPKPVTGSVSVSLSPGSTPPVIRPFMGSTSSFVVVDSTGAPWPVENFRIANPDLFPINRLDGPQGSAFTVDTMVPYGQSNLVLKLAGVAAPVVISLVAGQREHDARVEVRIQGRGPNSTVSSGSLMAGTDARLLPVLDGVTPEGGKSVTVSGLDGIRAWMLPSGKLLVRSPVKIVSPASREFVVSADGTHVYSFDPTTQLLGLVDGQFIQMTVGGW